MILVVLAVPAGRKLLLSRLTTTLGQVIPRLLDIVQQPRQAGRGHRRGAVVNAAYICCLAVSVRAFGGSLSLVAVAVVYLTGSAIDRRSPRRAGSARWKRHSRPP